MNENIELLKKYNLWGSSTFDFGYLRNGYTGKIADAVGNLLVKVLLGQRRSGKSFIKHIQAWNLYGFFLKY